jgi:hypothetical protein
MVDRFKHTRSLDCVAVVQKKTPRVVRPKGFLRANPFGSTHRHKGEKLLEDYHRNMDVNTEVTIHE